MIQGDLLFAYDVQDDTRTKIAELDFNFNEKKKTFSSTESHSLLIHFSTDYKSTWKGFSADILYVPIKANCANFLAENKLILTQLAIDCNWLITGPSVTSKISIQFQYFEVYLHMTSPARQEVHKVHSF